MTGDERSDDKSVIYRRQRERCAVGLTSVSAATEQAAALTDVASI